MRLRFGGQYIRPLHEDLRRQTAGRSVSSASSLRSSPAGRVGRQGHAQQQHQRVGVLRHLAGVLREIGLGGGDGGFRLMQIERRRDSAVKARLDQRQRFFLALERLLGDLEQLLVRQPGQIGARHFGHHTDQSAAAGFHIAKILLQTRVVQTANPPEQIEFVGGEADSHVEVPHHAGAGRHGRGGADPARGSAAGGDPGYGARIFFNLLDGAGVDLRKQLGPLDLVLRARGGNVELGDARIRIVLDGEFHQMLQPLVGEGTRASRCRRPPPRSNRDSAAVRAIHG